MGVYRTNVTIDPSTGAPSAVDLVQIAATNPSTFVGTLAAWNELSSEDKVERHGSLVTLTGSTTVGDGGSGAYYNNMGTLVPLIESSGIKVITYNDIVSVTKAAGTDGYTRINVVLNLDDIYSDALYIYNHDIILLVTSTVSNALYKVCIFNRDSTQEIHDVYSLMYGYPLKGLRRNGGVFSPISDWINGKGYVVIKGNSVISYSIHEQYYNPATDIGSRDTLCMPWLTTQTGTNAFKDGIALRCKLIVRGDGICYMTLKGTPFISTVQSDYPNAGIPQNIPFPINGHANTTVNDAGFPPTAYFYCVPLVSYPASGTRIAYCISSEASPNINNFTYFSLKYTIDSVSGQGTSVPAPSSYPDTQALCCNEVTLLEGVDWRLEETTLI